MHGCQIHSVRAQMQCNKLVKEITVCVSPLLSDMPCASKCKGASNRKMILVTHSCNQFSTSENVHSRAPYFVKTKEHSQTSFRKRTSISNKQCHEVSGDVENFRKNLALSEFQRLLPTLPPELGKSQLRRIINRPGESGLAGVVGQKFIHFGVI